MDAKKLSRINLMHIKDHFDEVKENSFVLKNSPVRISPCLSIQHVVLDAQNENLILRELNFSINLDFWLQDFERNLRKTFRSLKNFEVNSLTDREKYLCLAFENESSLQNSDCFRIFETRSIMGFKINLECFGNRLEIQLSDFFAIGNTPDGLPALIMKLLTSSLHDNQNPINQEKSPSSYQASSILWEITPQNILQEYLALVSEGKAETLSLSFQGAVRERSFDTSSEEQLEYILQYSALSANKGEWVFDIENKNAPIEIMETRELRKKFSAMEEKLFHYDTLFLQQHIHNLLSKEPNSEYVQKRSALAYLSGIHNPLIQSHFLGLHPDSETPWIIWSSCIKAAIQSRNEDKTLNLLRSFLKEVLKNSLPLHSSALFDAYLPESLASLLQNKSPEKAYELLKHVYPYRKEDAQLISKICAITARLGLKEDEKNWLQKAIALDVADPHLSPLLLRIAEIEMFSENNAAAVNFALKAIKANPSSATVISSAADILIESKRYQDALRVINDLLESPMIKNASNADKALLFWKLGKIWLDKFSKVDLAKAKFESALECEPLHVATLVELREIFLKENKYTPLAEVLKRLMEYFERHTNPEQFQKYRNELADLYKNHLSSLNDQDIEKNLYQSESSKEETKKENSELLEKEPNMDIWTYPEIDWQVYHDGLQNRLKSESLSLQDRFKLRILLSDICRHKLHKNEWAVKHLLIAGESEFISEEQFKFLLDNFQIIQDPKLFSSVVLKQLLNLSDTSRPQILSRILGSEIKLDIHIRQNLTWELYSVDQESAFKYLFDGIKSHCNNPDVSLLKKDLHLLSLKVKNPDHRDIILDFLFEKVIELNAEIYSEIITTLLELAIEHPPESKDTLQSLARYSAKNSFQTELRAFCEMLLDKAQVPSIPEATFLELFKADKVSLGLFYELRASQSKNHPTQSLKDLEKALTYYNEESTSTPRILKLLLDWYQNHEASVETIKNLLANKQEDFSSKINLLERQFEIQAEKPEIQFWILQQAIDLQTNQTQKDSEKISKYLHQSLEILHTIFNIKEAGFSDRSYAKWYDLWIQAITFEAKDVFKRIASDIISQDDSLRDYKKVLLFFEVLKNYPRSWAQMLLEMMSEKIDVFLSEEKYYLAGVYAEFFNDLDIHNEVTEKALLIFYLQEKQEAKLEPLLNTMLHKFSPIQSFYSFLETQRQIFLSSGFRKSFDKVLIQYLHELLQTNDSQPVEYDKAVEILLMIKTYHESFDKMHEVLEKLWSMQTEDPRTWTLCFYSFRQNSDKIAYKNFLLRIQDKIQTNPGSYTDLKINLELIQQELDDLKNTPSFKNWRDLFSSNAFESLDHRKKILYLQTLGPQDRLRCFQALVVRCEDSKLLKESEKTIPDQILWRKTSKLLFDLNAKERLKGIEVEKLLNSDMYKLLLSLSPSFSRIFRTRHNFKYIKNYLGVKSYKEVQKSAVQISWDSDDLVLLGLHHYKGRITRNEYKFFNLAGLKSKVFFDLPSKCFYFDMAHYRDLPPTHLRYEILDLMWQNKLGYSTILGLHPEKQIIKSIQEIKSYIESTPFEKLQSLILRTESDPFHILQGIDQDSFRRHLQNLSIMTASEVENIQNAMRRRVYICMLAESLDLIGLMEWSENINLVDNETSLEGLFEKPVAKFLLDIWLKLKS